MSKSQNVLFFAAIDGVRYRVAFLSTFAGFFKLLSLEAAVVSTEILTDANSKSNLSRIVHQMCSVTEQNGLENGMVLSFLKQWLMGSSMMEAAIS